VGRLDELAELRELVGRERLVTLTGPAGIETTRLAVQLASEMVPEFPDGTVFVGLAPPQEPELVAATAQALRVREEGREGPLQALKDHLAERRSSSCSTTSSTSCPQRPLSRSSSPPLRA
jgi:predicted ATPase